MPLPITDNRLTIADLSRELTPRGDFPGMDRSAIQRFDSVSDVRELLGKSDTLYPYESLKWWRLLAEARKRPGIQLEPKFAGPFLRDAMKRAEDGEIELSIIEPSPKYEGHPTGGELAVQNAVVAVQDAIIGQFTEIMGKGFTQAVTAATAQVLASVQPPQVDKLLTLKEAMDETGLSARTVRGLPSVSERAGGRRKWKRSTLLRKIEEMGVDEPIIDMVL